MKALTFLLLPFIFFLSSVHSSAQTDSTEFRKVAGFSHPESVVIDERDSTLYVSNMGGLIAGDGFLSKVSLEGQILDTFWFKGLDDPKGLLVLKDKLYVTDNTRVVEIAIETAEQLNEFTLKNAVMLNDIAADAKGHIFVTDTRRNAIYRMGAAGRISEWLITEELESPNGVYVTNNNIWIASWGSGDKLGSILKIDPVTLEVQRISEPGMGNLDGLQQNVAGEFYFSDWASGKIYKINAEGNAEEVVTSARSVGDILLLESRGLLILPMNLQNEVWWYTLKN